MSDRLGAFPWLTPPMPLQAGGLFPTALMERSIQPTAQNLKHRNTALDWLFYDIGNLTSDERAMLVSERNREGSILVVWPDGEKGPIGVQKFDDHATLRAEPGALLRRFAIAGVGSSDVGAASFARTIANRYKEPVGAIVAGYGVADLMTEALGGWFVLGAANRTMDRYHQMMQELEDKTGQMLNSTPDLSPDAVTVDIAPALEVDHAAPKHRRASDTSSLISLLNDEDRTILSIAGHSKGCLSIAYALESLALGANKDLVTRAQAIRIMTTGAVVALPDGFDNVGHYIGALDWFGGMNSRLDLPSTRVAGAWHHLNTSLPMHMDFAAVLADEAD